MLMTMICWHCMCGRYGVRQVLIIDNNNNDDCDADDDNNDGDNDVDI